MTELNEILNVPMDVKPISLDYEQMRVRLNEMLEPYKGIIVTEDNYKLCKEKKDEVGRIGRELDDARKAIKKIYEKPLKDFEKEIKELVAIADKVKKEISDQLDVFDNKRKEEKRNIAEQIIDEMVGEYELNEKFAGQVELKKNYMNLTAKESDVRADVEAQCMALKQKQDAEDEVRKVIRDTVASENETLKAKLNPDEFLSLMERIPSAEIISRIVKRAKDVHESESEAHRQQEKAEQEQVINNTENVPEIENKSFQEIEEEPEPKTAGVLYRVTYVVTGTEPQLKTISRFLKSNKYTYEVESQFPVG